MKLIPLLAALCIVHLAMASAEESAASAVPTPSSEPKTDLYRQDIEFLLKELPKQAGQFFEVKKIDWPKVETEFREAVTKVTNDGEHLQLCSRLLARLRDGHAAIVDGKVAWPDESQGRRWTGPRVHLVTIGERVFVRAAFGPAENAGIKTGMEVEKIDGQPAGEWLKHKVESMRDLTGFSTDHQALYAACHGGLADWSGTKIAFDLKADDGTAKTIVITRDGGPNYAPIGPVHPPKDLKAVGRQSYGKTAAGFGYIHLRDAPANLPTQLDEMLAGIGDVPGLILDMRANGGGGCDHEAVFGRFLATGAAWRQYRSQGAHPFAGPMVVIIDATVRSTGETVAGMFKEDGRAYIIGDTPTAGMSSQKTKLPLPSGLFSAYFSVHSNKARFNNGRGIEGIGVLPNETVPYDPKELATGIDTQIRRAEELLTKGFPAGAVPYQSPPQ